MVEKGKARKTWGSWRFRKNSYYHVVLWQDA